MSPKEKEALMNDDKFLAWLTALEEENQKFMIKYHGKRKKGNRL